MAVCAAAMRSIRSVIATSPSHLSRIFPYRTKQLSPGISSLSSSLHTSTTRRNEHVFNVQDEEDFSSRVRNSASPVIIDFHASWCGPCKLLGPRLEMIVSNKQGKVLLAKVDIDELNELAIGFGVEAVPTIVAMKKGKPVDKFVGMKDDAEIQAFVNKAAGD